MHLINSHVSTEKNREGERTKNARCDKLNNHIIANESERERKASNFSFFRGVLLILIERTPSNRLFLVHSIGVDVIMVYK